MIKQYWKMGQSKGIQPRVIHDMEHTVLVVPAVYSCPNEHTMSATDPSIMSMLTAEEQPFTLLHRTGFTKCFLRSIIHLISESMTISAVESYIIKSRRHYAASLLMQVKHALVQHSVNHRYEDLVLTSSPFDLIQTPFPSNDIIYKCFLVDFFDNRELYDTHMQQLSASKFISFDHTFKTASNIGFLRADKKWITQYNSVFFVMNEVGQVIAWQLTKSTSIDEVHNLLQNVAGRLCLESSTLFPIYVDNCCLLRQKLLHSIGPNIVVKLDLFHAVQRITKTLPKRHPFFHQCVDELKLVFRQPNDLGRKRTAPTPDAECISKNIDDFVKKWDKCLHQEWKLVQDKTLHEVYSLKGHIIKGVCHL